MDNPPSPDGRPADEPDDGLMQQFERSLEFWVTGREDYPPAIRGAVADVGDLPGDVQELVQRIGRHEQFPDLRLQRLIWFDDKNDKLDDACSEAKKLFRPLAVDADGLVSLASAHNPVLDRPSRHRMVVSSQFARDNYRSTEMIADADSETDGEIPEKSWKRKFTQTLKPWAFRQGDKLEHSRPPSDLLLTLNALLSRTKHGWLVADLYKLRERRGAILTYARTYEKQRRSGQSYEFKLELFGAAAELQRRLGDSLNRLACVYLENDSAGTVFLTKAAVYPEDDWRPTTTEGDQRVTIPLDARVCLEDGKPSQVILDMNGEFCQTKLRPMMTQVESRIKKVDLRKLASDGSRFCFRLQLRLHAPLLVGSSGDALLFELPDFLKRFTATDLPTLRAEATN